MKLTEMRDKTITELKDALILLLKEQFNLRMQKGVGQPIKPDAFSKVRRNIARVKTIIQEKGSV